MLYKIPLKNIDDFLYHALHFSFRWTLRGVASFVNILGDLIAFFCTDF